MTFASVVCMNSWKLILALCIIHDLYIHHFDIITAFLNEILDELLYMQYSIKYRVAGYILKLLKTLYSLKQSSCVWYTCLCKHFKVIKLVVNPYDPSVFINKGLTVNIIVAAYINDLLICDSFMNLVDCILKHLQSEFEMTDLEEVANYLNIKLNIAANFITVCQCEYIQSVLKCFCMNKCKPVVVLMPPSTKLVAYQEPFNTEHQRWYRSAVGSLIWPATQCRPNIAYSVRVVSQYSHNLSKKHKQAVLQIFCYLKDTVNWGLIYTKNSSNHLVSYSNSDYTSDITIH